MSDRPQNDRPSKKRDEDVQSQIDANLRKIYGQKVEEAIPDRFANLLEQLRAKSASK